MTTVYTRDGPGVYLCTYACVLEWRPTTIGRYENFLKPLAEPAHYTIHCPNTPNELERISLAYACKTR